MKNNLYIVTVATHTQGYFKILQKSCERHGLNLIVLGFGKKWQGFAWKFKLIRDFLEFKDNEDIIVFIDAFDVIALNNMETILERFILINKPIIVSQDFSHVNSFSKYTISKVFPKCKNTFINSGGYIGKVWALKKMFDKICKINDCNKFNNDDQRMMISLCNDPFFDKYMTIDFDQLIFLTVMTNNWFSSKTDLKIDNLNLVVGDKGIEPCFVHGPGNADLSKIIQIYNYNFKDINKQNSINGIFHRIPLYIHFFYDDIYIIILLILFCIICYLKNKL